jgi:hypothetical protein
MALLLHAKGRAYPQSAPASKPEEQEVRSKENPDWKNPGEEKKKNLLAGFTTAAEGLLRHR